MEQRRPMRVLYITGACLTRNTSANMSHNAFVQGLLENACDVDILMAKESWGEPDGALPTWGNANYICFDSVSVADRLRLRLRGQAPETVQQAADSSLQPAFSAHHVSLKAAARAAAKSAFYTVFPQDPLYPLEKEWLKNAAHFRAREGYDLVVSNSSPAASHRLAELLLQKGNISAKRWIQIWEDPWYHDLYGGHSQLVEQEEHRLLQAATEVVYVSPLTLMYQKRYYPDCADKMRCVPLPALQINGNEELSTETAPSFGYFGDYYTATRNLKPFYEALKASGFPGAIIGDSDLRLPPTDKIRVSGRMTLDRLIEIQKETRVLVHLSNLRGGQIPGKIYHYSVTERPILFILDGTEEEKRLLREHFGRFERYVFCENTQESIRSAMVMLIGTLKKCAPVKEFLPKAVINEML